MAYITQEPTTGRLRLVVTALTNGTNGVCNVHNNGYVSGYGYYDNSLGVRPIVSIPISNAQIGADGTVTIK